MSLLKQIIGEIVEFDFGIKLNKEHSITVLCSDSKINIINFNDNIPKKIKQFVEQFKRTFK